MKRMARTGFTLVEIMIVVAIIALLAAIAVPNVLRGRTSANEAAAIGNMRALNSSLQMYQSVNSTFPSNWLANMYTNATPPYGPNSFNAALAGKVVQGYSYTYTPLPANCAGTAASPCSNYTITTDPQTLGTTGTRSFYTDSTGEIRHCTAAAGKTAAAASVTIDQPPAAC